MIKLFRKLIYEIRLLFACNVQWKLKKGYTVTVGRRVSICPCKYIQLGNNVFIGDDVLIRTSESGQSPITIGNFVMIAARVMIIGGNHALGRTDVPIMSQGEGKQGPIIVEDDVWIGAGSIIISGTTIGKGSVIGAGSVVVGPIPEYSIAVGNPCRVVKNRLKTINEKS